MALVKSEEVQPFTPIFDKLSTVLHSESYVKLDLDSYIPILSSGKLPYVASETSKRKLLATSPKIENGDYIIFISNKLGLATAETLKLIDFFGKKIKSNSDYQLPNNKLLTYYLSMILQQQSLCFKNSLEILLSDKTNSMIDNIKKSIISNGHNIIEQLIENIHHVIRLQNKLSLSTLEIDVFIVNNLDCLLTTMLNYFIHLIIKSEKGFMITTVSKWFNLIEDTQFLSTSLSSLSNLPKSEVKLTIECLSTLITLLFLDLDFNFGSIDNKSSFMSDPKKLINITTNILNTKANPIILYAWSIILHRQQTILEINKDDKLYQDYANSLSESILKDMENVYTSFVEQASQLNVCDSLINCNNLISYDPIFPSILGSFVIAFIPYVEPTYEIINTVSTILRNSPNKIIEKFFDNDSTEELLILLKAKMPLTLNTFLELISINSNLAVEELRSLPTFMVNLEISKFNPNYAIDDQQPELVKLIKDLNIPLPFESNNEMSLLMKKDSKAQIISSSDKTNQVLVMFIYEYNGWSLLGRILKNLSIKISKQDKEKEKTLCVLLKTLNKILIDLDEKVIDLIFHSMNAFIDEHDIIDIIFRIFDQALFLKNTELLMYCLTFFDILCHKGFSYKVWSYIFKSDLFSFKANGSLALEILDKVEITTGSYKFLKSLLKLGNTLLNSALIYHDNINNNLKSQVIEYFTIFSIQIFENFFNWKYSYEYEKYEIGNFITSFLNKIIEFEISLNENERSKLLPVFGPSFKKIINRFLILDLNDSRSVYPLLSTIIYLSESNLEYSTMCTSSLLYSQWIDNAVNFSINLIKLCSNVHPKLLSNLEKQLYSNLTSLVESYLLNNKYKILLLNLLTDLVKSSNEKPPSMLTHLHDTHANILLNSLYEDISNETSSNELKIASFKFISSVMENNQKGLSLFLITGKNVPSKNSTSLGDKSIFNLLKNSVVKITDYQSEYTYHLLNSVSLCIGVWLNVFSDNNDTKFVDKLLKIIEDHNLHGDQSLTVWEAQIISKTVEILSLYLFVSNRKDKACEVKICQLFNSNKFIVSLESKFKVKSKDQSLVLDINEKLNSYFKGDINVSQLLNFDINNISQDLYNFDLINALFAKDDINDWEAIKSDLIKEQDEMKLIQSQIQLAKSYGGLITCYCNVNSAAINPEYCLLASSLLEINFEQGISHDVYDQLYKARVELSFLIILTVSKLGKPVSDSTLILIITSCLKLLELREVNLFQDLTSLNVEYYKPLLRTLLLSISMIKTSEFVAEYSSTLTDVFQNIICKSINVLFNNIRNQALSVYIQDVGSLPLINKQVDDILIIFSLVQEFFKLKLSSKLDAEISNILIKSGAYRSIAQMFISSHLIKLENEEIFMDYSLSFICEFVQRKNMAEKLINDGIFQLLTESPVALIIQKGNINPYSNNLIIVRLHKLWVKRILPIVLTIIGHFGENITFAICKFALTFKKQFQYTIQAWLETGSLISPSIIEETEQLILFAKLLSGLDCYNYVSSELGKNIEDVKLVPGLDTIQERKTFVNALNYLLTHPKYLSMKVRTIDGEITISQLTEELKLLKDSLLD
jgi:nuclear pore complex protein Nup188